MALPGPPEPGTSGALQFPVLLQACPELLQASRIIVGFSGGVDSTVLLFLLHQARTQGALSAPVHAFHVNHALQAAADPWQEHCRQVCTTLDIPFQGVRAPVVPVPGESLEECARNARHGLFAELLQQGEVLALAQHRDDQVETVLFRLLRGSGVAGLAGMPRSRTCGKGLLLRPLLECSRRQVLAFAREQQLHWIEDASNQDQRFDRNFLRGTVLPLLYQRWPGLGGAVQRTARLSAETAQLLDALAAIDCSAAAGPYPGQLRIDALLPLPEARQRNAVRFWLQLLAAQLACAAPTHQILHRVLTEVLRAGQDAEPLLRWGSGEQALELRRHHNLLHVLRPLPAVGAPLTWQTASELTLPAPLGALTLQQVTGAGLPRDRLGTVRVSFRGGGELVKAAGRPTRPLKKILQDAGIPGWLRERIPLLYVGDELVAVADLLICEGWLSDTPGNSCQVVWRHPDLDCGYPPHLLI